MKEAKKGIRVKPAQSESQSDLRLTQRKEIDRGKNCEKQELLEPSPRVCHAFLLHSLLSEVVLEPRVLLFVHQTHQERVRDHLLWAKYTLFFHSYKSIRDEDKRRPKPKDDLKEFRLNYIYKLLKYKSICQPRI